MEIFACFMLCGTLVSLLVPETKSQTLEVLAGEAPFRGREGSIATAGRRWDLLSRLDRMLGLCLHTPGNKEVGKKHRDRQDRNSSRGTGYTNNDLFKADKQGYSDSMSNGGGGLQFPKLNEDETCALTRQHTVEDIPFRDVGMLLR
jgi:hypothetical protein